MQVVVYAVLSAAGFGAALVTTQFALKHGDAASGARISIPAATLLFWLLAPFVDWAGGEAAAVGTFALVGLFFPAAVTLLTFEGNRRLGPTMTGTIGSTAPLFAVLGAALFLDEALGLRELTATSLIVLGTMALSRPRGPDVEAWRHSALWLPWSAAALRALAQILSSAGLAIWANPFAAALVGYTVSSAVVWTLALAQRRRPQCDRRGAAWFAVTGILNGVAVLCLYRALSMGTVVTVSPIVATYPLFTLFLSALVLRAERMNAILIGGVALTVSGVIVLLVR